MDEKLVRLLGSTFKSFTPNRLTPGSYLQARSERAADGQVYTWPFRGIRYIDRAFCSALRPKFLGVYELELHPTIELACNTTFDRIIDIGCAEGYTAV